jgi:hypothetical protein
VKESFAMKTVTRRHFLTASKAGLVGLRPRPPAPNRDAEATRRGYQFGLLLVRTETFGGRSRDVYAHGAVRNRVTADRPAGAVATFTYDATRAAAGSSYWFGGTDELPPVAPPVVAATCLCDTPGLGGSVSSYWYGAAGEPLCADPPVVAATYVYDATGALRSLALLRPTATCSQDPAGPLPSAGPRGPAATCVCDRAGAQGSEATGRSPRPVADAGGPAGATPEGPGLQPTIGCDAAGRVRVSIDPPGRGLPSVGDGGGPGGRLPGRRCPQQSAVRRLLRVRGACRGLAGADAGGANHGRRGP